MTNSATTSPAPAPAPPAVETRFVNGMRLSGLHWLAVVALVALTLVATPWLWKQIERFDTGPDYRIPYPLSKDYWLYQRRLERIQTTNIAVLGDSVIWGEYVGADGTLSHFLNDEDGQEGRFVNGGVNGLFPLAFEGLIRHYGLALSRRKVLLHCNVLWMSSPKADLHTEKEERFNHADLVPQFFPRLPCYKADLNRRLAAVVQRHFSFSQWVDHVQVAYFEQKNVLTWTLEEDGNDSVRYPNAYKNPLTQITLRVPAEPGVDPDRGPSSPRHKPWSTTGEGSTHFEWVELDRSLQWAAFVRLVKMLQARGNDLFVVIGPFNEHIMAADNRPAFQRLRAGVADWLARNQVPHAVSPTLPSVLYADASHPLTEGYRQVAHHLHREPAFQTWSKAP